METLPVKPLRTKLTGQGIAQLDKQTADAISVDPGSFIRLEHGDKEAVLRLYGSGRSEDCVRIDAQTRRDLGVGVDQTVDLSEADVVDARSIEVSLNGDLKTVGDVEMAIRKGLEGQVVWPDRSLRVPFPEPASMEVPGRVESMEPEEPAFVTETTTVTVSHDVESETTPVTYDDIGGLNSELEQLREMIELPTRHPELFDRVDVDAPNGVILHGPPGTGKTLMAKAVANENESYFESISGPEIMSKYYGESEGKLREVFERAQENAPAIVFIDELDSIAPDRDDSDNTERRIVAQLLALMDGLDAREQVTVVAATNRLDAIDGALRRPGRFDREVEIGVPDKDARRHILNVHTRNVPISDDVDVDELSTNTHGFVGADLENLAREAAMNAIRRHYPDLDLDKDHIPADALQEIVVTSDDFQNARLGIEPSAMREVFVEVPDVSWDNVGGLDDTKQQLQESVEWPLSHADTLQQFAADPPSGILLYGPPGTGKTLMAKAVANESDANFISVKGPELLSKWVGESEEGVREIFKKARENAPTVVFFDELDAIAGQRGGGEEDSGVGSRVVSQMLTELDGLQALEDVTVIATTNRPDLIDGALLRPGRLDRKVHVPVPGKEARREIFDVHMEDMPTDHVNVDALVRQTGGFVGADVEALCQEASMVAAREAIQGDDIDTIEHRHFEEAVAEVGASVPEEVREEYEKMEETVEKESLDEGRQHGAAFM